MNQTEKRCWLIKELQTDMPEYGALTIPETPEEQKKLLRSPDERPASEAGFASFPADTGRISPGRVPAPGEYVTE